MGSYFVTVRVVMELAGCRDKASAESLAYLTIRQAAETVASSPPTVEVMDAVNEVEVARRIDAGSAYNRKQ